MGNAVALANLDPEPLIARIADGAFLRDLAIETGIDKRRLSEALRKHPDYRSAKRTCIEVQLEEAQEAIRGARESVDIACAREQFRAAAWRAERECPEEWGAKQQLVLTHTLSVDEGLGSLLDQALAGRVIDGSTTEIGVDSGVTAESDDEQC